jgi:hypothetical protein
MTKRHKLIRIIFPNAFGAGKGWGMAAVWAMLFFMGYISIESCFGLPSTHIFPWEVRMLVGIIVCYASTSSIINKLIVNGVI